MNTDLQGQLLTAILGTVGLLLSGVVSFVLGKRHERYRQTMAIRAEMLKPIEEWLGGVERMVGMFADTISSVVQNSPYPLMYNLDERRKAAQLMSEKTNVVFGILTSKSLQMRQTRKNAQQLHEIVITLDNLIKYQMLPLDNQVLDYPAKVLASPGFAAKVGDLKLRLDTLVQTAYSLIAKIKTTLT